MNILRKSEVNVQPPTFISEKINAAMGDRSMSIRDLAAALDGSYENVRRIVNGDQVPSQYLLDSICEILALNKAEMRKLLNADKIRKKFGTIPLELSGKKADMEPLDRIWDYLNPQQKNGIITMAQGWAKQNKLVSN